MSSLSHNQPQKSNSTRITPEEAKQSLLKRNYVKLELGSYRSWIKRNWHEWFVNKGIVRQNAYSQFCVIEHRLQEFNDFNEIYERYIDALNFHRMLSPQDMKTLKEQGLIRVEDQSDYAKASQISFNLDSGGRLSGQPDV